ncbi:MAG: hypothetical protein ACFBZ8_10560 [Opitutales bacterium]
MNSLKTAQIFAAAQPKSEQTQRSVAGGDFSAKLASAGSLRMIIDQSMSPAPQPHTQIQTKATNELL